MKKKIIVFITVILILTLGYRLIEKPWKITYYLDEETTHIDSLYHEDVQEMIDNNEVVIRVRVIIRDYRPTDRSIQRYSEKNDIDTYLASKSLHYKFNDDFIERNNLTEYGFSSSPYVRMVSAIIKHDKIDEYIDVINDLSKKYSVESLEIVLDPRN